MHSTTHLIRLARTLAVAAVVAGAAVSAAQAGTGPLDRGTPDTRDAAQTAVSQAALPDVIERYAAAHPYGQTRAPAEVIASHFKHEDALYRAQDSASGLPRSATAIQPGASDGFDWSDYGVGIGTGIGLVLLFAGGLAGARQRRHRMQAA
jgi:hypothetical protein